MVWRDIGQAVIIVPLERYLHFGRALANDRASQEGFFAPGGTRAMQKLDSLARVQLSLIYVELRTNLVCTTDRNHDRNNVRQYWSYLSIMETLMASLPLSHSFNEFYDSSYVHQAGAGSLGF